MPTSRISTERRLAAIRELQSKGKEQYGFFVKLGISISAFCITQIVLLLYYTYRVKSFSMHPKAKSLIQSPEGQFIILTWHSRIFYVAASVSKNIISKKNDVLTLISPSRDGELMKCIAVYLGAYCVRGSASRKGASALRKLLRYANLRFQPCTVGDGPRGPRYKLKKGLISLSQLSGLPILPICYSAKKEWRNRRAWDHMAIPKPFTSIALEYGEPIYLTRKMDIEEARLLVEKKMQRQWQRLEAFFHKETEDFPK